MNETIESEAIKNKIKTNLIDDDNSLTVVGENKEKEDNKLEMALNNSTNKSFKRLQRVFQMQNVLENQIHKKQELEH